MRRSISFALLALFLSASPNALAQDDPRKAQAAPLFEEGRKHAEKGENAESLEKFRKAFSIYPSPNTLFNVARQEQVLGQRTAALRDYREALKNPILLPQLAEMARAHVAELERSLGRVNVVGPANARVTVAGTEYTLPLAAPIDVEPGSIAIRGVQGSTELSASANATPGQLVTVDLGAKDSPAIEPPPATSEDPAPNTTTRNIVALSLGAVGIASATVGAVFLAKAESNVSDASALPPRDPRFGSLRDDYSENRTLGWVGVGVGAALVAGTVVTFVLWSKSSSNRATLAPAAVGTGGVLSGTF